MIPQKGICVTLMTTDPVSADSLVAYAYFIPKVGVGKERHILIGKWSYPKRKHMFLEEY